METLLPTCVRNVRPTVNPAGGTAITASAAPKVALNCTSTKGAAGPIAQSKIWSYLNYEFFERSPPQTHLDWILSDCGLNKRVSLSAVSTRRLRARVTPATAPAWRATAPSPSASPVQTATTWRAGCAGSIAPCGLSPPPTAPADAAPRTATCARTRRRVSVSSAAAQGPERWSNSWCLFKLDGRSLLECSFLYLMHNGACKASCTAGYYEDMEEGRCGQCHPTCGSCSGPLADDCETCSTLSPKLYKGSCSKECPTGTYYATEALECQGKFSCY